MDASHRWRLLLVEDDEADALLVRAALGEQWDILHVNDLDAAREALVDPFALLMLDLGLPGSRSAETLRTVLGWRVRVPIVVVTGTVDVDLGAQFIAMGAEDFVSKDELRGPHLHRVLDHAVARHRVRPDRPAAVVVAHLDLMRGDHVIGFFPIGRQGARIGRSPDNLVALDDPRLSRHHAMVWVEDGAAWIEDLGSINGTLVNGRRTSGPVRLAPGDQVGFGHEIAARIRVVEPSLPPSVLDPRASRILADLSPPGDTEDEDGLLPYTLDVSLSDPEGCRARIDGPHGRYAVEAVHRVSLLYVLAQRREEDLSRGTAPADAGWVSNWDAAVGIWGRKHASDQSQSALRVLLHRVRRELEDAGIDPEVIQRRRGGLRLGVRRVVLR